MPDCHGLLLLLVQEPGPEASITIKPEPWDGDIAEGRSRLSGFHVLCDEVMFIILSLSLSI